MDTLVRIFDAKYYPPGGMEAAMEELFAHAWLVCARRGSGGESTDAADTRRQEDALLARADVARWVARGRIRLIRAPESVADVSSTRVRMALRMGAGAGALRGLCADPVAKYLLEQRLYRG
jgi:nicotinic acid mononucleotide adenylyltransferase